MLSGFESNGAGKFVSLVESEVGRVKSERPSKLSCIDSNSELMVSNDFLVEMDGLCGMFLNVAACTSELPACILHCNHPSQLSFLTYQSSLTTPTRPAPLLCKQ